VFGRGRGLAFGSARQVVASCAYLAEFGLERVRLVASVAALVPVRPALKLELDLDFMTHSAVPSGTSTGLGPFVLRMAELAVDRSMNAVNGDGSGDHRCELRVALWTCVALQAVLARSRSLLAAFDLKVVAGRAGHVGHLVAVDRLDRVALRASF
jgi:hypothetical protein